VYRPGCLRVVVGCWSGAVGHVRALAAIAIVLSAMLDAATAEPKRVMLLHSFGRDFKPWSEYAKSIRAELDRQSPWPLDITDHSLVTARSSDEDPERPFVEYLGALFAKRPLDLIVSIGAPAAAFVQRHRQQLFATTPMVFTAVDKRRVQYSALTAKDAVVAVSIDYRGAIENILRVLPDTKFVTVVVGTSPIEKFWKDAIAKDAAPLTDRIALSWTDHLSFEELLKHAAALPRHSAIFWELMIVDAAGVVHEGSTPLIRLHAVANAPIFSYDESFFGDAIVGGPILLVQDSSRETAAVAVRILGGEKGSDIEIPPVGFATPRYDWREMQRWGISESRLPPGSKIFFRPPGAWEQFWAHILAICGVVILQAALIAWLIYEHRRRLLAEGKMRNSISELTQLNRIAGAGELSASIAHEVNQPLTAIANSASAGLNWLKTNTPNIEEACAALGRVVDESHRAGAIVKSLRAMFRKDTQESGPLDINTIILAVLELVQIELLTNDIKLVTELEDGLPLVSGREVQLQQVILNLIMNAKEAMQSTRSRRVLRVRSELRDSGQVQVSIEDSGTGISQSDLERVFEPMFTTKPHGMGMGLSICRSIIESHNGRIWVTPGLLRGSSFQFTLPAR